MSKKAKQSSTATSKNINRSGGINLSGQAVEVSGDVVGGSKITYEYFAQLPIQPRQAELPHQPYFFGRKKELERIAKELSPEARGWGVLIDGPGGIGKTALALCAGHQAPAEIFHTKIFLSAKQFVLTPEGPRKVDDSKLLNYKALITELARQLGDDGIERVLPANRTQEVTRLLHNRYALIIVDNLETFNAAERQRMIQFLNCLPLSCKAIVTSRRRTDAAALTIRLGRLEKEESLTLIARIAERNKYLAKASEDEWAQLYDFAKGNPLLIEWAAGQLGRPGSQCQTVADACRFLQSSPKDNDPLEFIFGDLLDTFTTHETAVLAALTHFTLPARVEWIAEIAGLSAAETETALKNLDDRALVDSDIEEEVYVLSVLVADFLRRKRPEAVADAGNRLADKIYALVAENKREDYQSFPNLEKHWPEIAAALPQFLQADINRLNKVCYALGTFLGASGHWDERLYLSLEAETRAVAAKEPIIAGWQAYNAGVVYFRRGQSAALFDCAKRVEQYWAGADAREKAYGMRLYGWWYRSEGKYSQAIKAYRKALELVRAVSRESLDVVFMLNSLGHAERDNNDYDAAERDYGEALRIARKGRFRLQIAESTGNLAEIALIREDWRNAEGLAHKALTGAEAFGHRDFTARNCLCLAEALIGQRRKKDSLIYARRAVEIFAKLRSPRLEKAQAVLKKCEGSQRTTARTQTSRRKPVPISRKKQ